VQISMLGPLEVRTGSGAVLDLAGARLRTLLILLALEPGRVVPTSRLLDELWGAEVPANATNALQALVSRLRRAVPGIVLTTRPAGYQLDVEPDAVDVRRFERLAAAGHEQVRTDPAGAAVTLRSALALWRGPALADVAEAGFALATIARLEELRLTAVQDRVDADLRLGAHAGLVAELEGLVAQHPLREPLIGRLMRAQWAAGQRGAALRVYEQARARLVDELGVEPSAELSALHLEILRAEVEPAPARTEPDPREAPGERRTNLRSELTSFVGRDDELAQVGTLVNRSRLTTLTGTGGAGKTRLATEAARAQLGAQPDGVWLVELAPVSDPAEVAQTVLAALGLRDHALVDSRRRAVADDPAEPADRLVAALSGQQALLVLDNCEHLIAAAAALADRILRASPRMRILATSREPLGITGEALWPVEPLALPPARADADEARRYAAVRLFADRARAVRPGFEVTEDNAAAVTAICRALDGIPLAIELAAARLRAMTPEQVAGRLGDRFRLLTGGSRTALPRHQTLRAVVGWSWELLDEAERALWRRLSVFAGGATTAAAERVCAGGPVPAEAVPDLLASLVEKSLLVVRDGDGTPRYRLLETIKAYGYERLDGAGEREHLRAAHAAYFLALAEEAQECLYGLGQLHWLDQLTRDHDNLHAAIRGAVAARDAPTAVRLVAALGWYWFLRGHKAEGAELTGEALAVPGDVADVTRGLAYAMGALLVIDSVRDVDTAMDWFTRAAEAATRVPPADQPPLLRMIGPLREVFEASRERRNAVAESMVDAVVDDADPWVGATARMLRGHLLLNDGHDHDRVEEDFRAALSAYRRLGERWGTAFTLASLADLAAWRGEHETAAEYAEEALGLVGELGSIEDQVQFRNRLALHQWMLGRPDRARRTLARAERDAQRSGLPEQLCNVARTAGDLARYDGDLAAARAHLDRAGDLVDREKRFVPQVQALVASSRGYLEAAEGNLAEARTQHAEALTTAIESADSPVVGQILVGLADLAAHCGDPALAATLLGASEAVRGTPDLSTPDLARVTAAARDALGAEPAARRSGDDDFDEAYRRGRATTVDGIRDLVGVLIPAA
jgi:predicted ATPase/DNA-binding SARP family transcriptional activator